MTLRSGWYRDRADLHRRGNMEQAGNHFPALWRGLFRRGLPTSPLSRGRRQAAPFAHPIRRARRALWPPPRPTRDPHSFVPTHPLSPGRPGPWSAEKSYARKVLCEIFPPYCRRGCDEAHAQNRRIAFTILQNRSILLIGDVVRRVGGPKRVEAGGVSREPAVRGRGDRRGPTSRTWGRPSRDPEAGRSRPEGTPSAASPPAWRRVVPPALGGPPGRSSAGISIAFRQHRARAIVWEPGTLPSEGRGRPRRYRLDPTAVAAREPGSSIRRRARPSVPLGTESPGRLEGWRGRCGRRPPGTLPELMRRRREAPNPGRRPPIRAGPGRLGPKNRRRIPSRRPERRSGEVRRTDRPAAGSGDPRRARHPVIEK